MTFSMRRFMPSVALVLLAVLALPLLAACDDNDGKASGPDNGALISAIVTLDNAGFHGMDDSINKENQIPANARSVSLKMQAVTGLTEWPDDSKATADQLEDLLSQFAAELDKDNPDMATAGDLAKKVHDVQHDLSHDVWAYLQQQAGVSGGGGSHD